MACEHVEAFPVTFDDRMPILEHCQCSECLHHWKTYGGEYTVPVTRAEVIRWWNRVLIGKGRGGEIVEIS